MKSTSESPIVCEEKQSRLQIHQDADVNGRRLFPAIVNVMLRFSFKQHLQSVIESRQQIFHALAHSLRAFFMAGYTIGQKRSSRSQYSTLK